MELINWIIDAILLLIHVLLSFAPRLVGLTLIASAAGAAMLWVFAKTSSQRQIKQVKRRISARLLELRLYVDEPAISLRAQKSLLAANLRYLTLALAPALWLAVPVSLLLVHLQSFYERAPLPLGQPALITMHMNADWVPSTPPPILTTPPNVAILGPPVRVAAAHEVSWRILPYSPVSANLLFRFNGHQVSRWIEAGDSQRFVTGRKVRSGWGTILFPGDGALGSDFTEWIDIAYPEVPLHLFGFRIHWMLWFLAVSMAAALLLKKRLGVVI